MDRDGRPPLAVRAGFGVLALGGLVFTGLLLLADRAPGLMRQVLGRAAERLWDRIDAAGAPSLGEHARARPDFVVHVIVWGTVTALVALTIWTVRGVALAAVAAFSLSLLLEFAQGVVTTTRSVQAGDVLGNACGVAAGAFGALVLVGAWWAGQRLIAGPPQWRSARRSRPGGGSPGSGVKASPPGGRRPGTARSGSRRPPPTTRRT